MSRENNAFDNPGFMSSKVDLITINSAESEENIEKTCDSIPNNESQTPPSRGHWGSGVEFLMSCIALSVGLGNVWRFPFIALENGGGAFLIPYIIVLFLVGKPIYYLEMILGQFSSRGGVKVFDYAPIMRGIGYGQVMSTFFIATYYASLMALTLRYLILSFYAILPWSYCRDEWGDQCIDSRLKGEDSLETQVTTEAINGSIKKTSAEHFFFKVILHETPDIDDGIGAPDWYLALTLAFSWAVIVSIVIRGIKTSGKAAYFLALFPYLIMLVLLVRSLTLPGAFDGVLYFLKPQWDKLLDASVWYAAVTQVFFSLTVCYGIIVMYSSYNRFDHNIARDCTIVTTLDTFTSLLSGIIIFGILGNLAHETGTTDIRSVVKGGPGLAFISYPDAIAKFTMVPQIFSALFFLMMFILGVGSNVGVITSVITVVCELFPNIKRWHIVIGICIASYCFGLMYVTPGGQYMLNYIDFYGVTFVAIVLGILELISAGWVYGVKNICRDIQFMLNIKTSLYYRLCWSIITPAFMTAILIYTLVEYKPLDYNGVKYPAYLYVIGWCISAFAICQLFVWAFIATYKRPEARLCDRIKNAFKPSTYWGPIDPSTLKLYNQSIDESNIAASLGGTKTGFWYKIYDNIFN
ncbi:sodium-dependent nutrient amino acid transporter 1-like [Calliphora vicina]|uniref:sodium-dependent nutrient amino acid transporter 1-like n=1 Tax=Calliphora vicina TaxID=7373 RepID=UPI00325B42F7